MARVKSIIAAALVVGACSEADEGRLVVRTVSEGTGAPTEGIRVQVGDEPWETTDAAGEAFFASVAEPFAVRLHGEGESWDGVIVLQGRSGDEVTAEISRPGPTEWHSARATGTVAARTGEPQESVIQVGVAPFKDWSAAIPAAADGSFDMNVPWREIPENSTATLVLHAWETDAATPPGHYYGFGHSPSIPFVEQGEVTGVTMPLDPVDEATVAAAISLPAGLDDPEVLARMWLRFGPYEQLTLASQLMAAQPFDLVVPSLPGVESWIGVWAGTGWHLRRADGASSQLSFAPPAAPELVEPAEGASVGQGAVYRWKPVEPDGSASLFVSCSPSDTTTGVSFFLEAEENEVTLPTIPDVGLPSGVICTWAVLWCAATDQGAEQRCSWSTERTIAP
jgi:hypothetical protein